MPNQFVIAPIGELHTLSGPAGLRRGAGMTNTGMLNNAGIAVIDGVIAEVGDAEDVLRKYDLPAQQARLVTPGLVDAHTHIVWGGDRADDFLRRCRGESYESIAAGGGGILSTMAATRAATLSDLTESVIGRANFMLRKGTTTIEVKASYGLSPEACKKELDAIVAARQQCRSTLIATFMGAHAFPPDYSRADFLSLVCNTLIPMAATHPASPQFCDVFCEIGAFTADESQIVMEAGIKRGLTPKIHADEFNDLGGVERAVALGAASCDHLLVTGEAGRRALGGSETAAVLMPGTAFYLGKPYADGRALADAGAAIALGTDFNPGSSMVCSMAFVMGLAVAHLGLSPEEALTGATVNAAVAIGSHGGRIEAGICADICLWPCDSLAELVWKYTFVEPDTVFVGGNALK